MGKGQTPSPAPFIHCHLKLYHKKYVSIEVFLYLCILQTDCSKYLFKRSFRLHRFRAPPHCEKGWHFLKELLGVIFDFRHVVNIICIAGPAEGPEEEALGVRQACHSCWEIFFLYLNRPIFWPIFPRNIIYKLYTAPSYPHILNSNILSVKSKPDFCLISS